MKDEYVSTEHLLLAIADEKTGDAGKILRQHGINRDDLLKVIEQTRGGARLEEQRLVQRAERHLRVVLEHPLALGIAGHDHDSPWRLLFRKKSAPMRTSSPPLKRMLWSGSRTSTV